MTDKVEEDGQKQPEASMPTEFEGEDDDEEFEAPRYETLDERRRGGGAIGTGKADGMLCGRMEEWRGSR